MCDQLTLFEMPTFNSRLIDAKEHFNIFDKYIKITKDECKNVEYLSYTGYMLLGRNDMFSKIKTRISNLEKNFNILFINVVVYKCFYKWLKICLSPPHGKLYIYYMKRFKCNQFV